jgi:hypothetical protein
MRMIHGCVGMPTILLARSSGYSRTISDDSTPQMLINQKEAAKAASECNSIMFTACQGWNRGMDYACAVPWVLDA